MTSRWPAGPARTHLADHPRRPGSRPGQPKTGSGRRASTAAEHLSVRPSPLPRA